jgi:hypothetical protein
VNVIHHKLTTRKTGVIIKILQRIVKKEELRVVPMWMKSEW